MSQWPSTKDRRLLAALEGIGWTVKRQNRIAPNSIASGMPDFVFSFNDNEEIGPRMLARIAKRTGLKPDDL